MSRDKASRKLLIAGEGVEAAASGEVCIEIRVFTHQAVDCTTCLHRTFWVERFVGIWHVGADMSPPCLGVANDPNLLVTFEVGFQVVGKSLVVALGAILEMNSDWPV